MKSNFKKLSIIAVVSMILFMIANTLTVLPELTTNYRPLFNTLGFAILLYGWALLGVWRHRKFAMGFVNFVNLVYSFGFISTLISGNRLITIVVSVVGLMVNGYWFWICRQSAHRLHSQKVS